jgi:hypothetical protein
MVDYSKAKIYKLVGYGLTYYGATTQSLSQRKTEHKTQKSNKCKSKEIFKFGDDIDIVLVENFPCKNKEELHKREREWIENNECVNRCIPTRTYKEWYNDNKDKRLDQYKEWREQNKDYKKVYNKVHKDKIKEQRKIYRDTHKDVIKEQSKKYYEANKDRILEKQREQYKLKMNK